MRTCATSLVSESDNAESENHSVESGKSDHTLKNWQYQEWKIDWYIINKKSYNIIFKLHLNGNYKNKESKLIIFLCISAVVCVLSKLWIKWRFKVEEGLDIHSMNTA